MTNFKLIENEHNNEEIDKINFAISEYNRAAKKGRPHPKFLQNIIDSIDIYIGKIPASVRKKSFRETDIPWEVKLENYPHAIEILTLQKKAVSLYFLPDADTDAEARWLLIRGLASDDSIHTPYAGKLMDPEYWDEVKYHGKRYIADWILERSHFSKHHFISFKETVEYNENLKGVPRRYVTHLDNPESFKLTRNRGKFLFRGRPIDSSRSYGTEIHTGEVIFVAGTDGSIFTSDPEGYVDNVFHHSSFLKGKPVICAGTLRFKKGQLVEITTASGHYKPDNQNLLNFLDLLKNHYKLDLSKVRVKTHNGGFRNAERFYKTKGVCLPDDKGELMYEHAVDAFKKRNEEGLHFYLDKAAELGHEAARFQKANFMATETEGYTGQKEHGISILKAFSKRSAYYFKAQQTLEEVIPNYKSTLNNFWLSEPEWNDQLSEAIETAFLKYYSWINTTSNGTFSIGILNPHGMDGIFKAQHLKNKCKTATFSEQIQLLNNFFSNNLRDDLNEVFSGKARANNHSFISFLLNELKEKESLIDEISKQQSLSIDLKRVINPQIDYHSGRAYMLREIAKDIFSKLGLNEPKDDKSGYYFQ